MCHFFDKAHKKLWMIMRLCFIFVVLLEFASRANVKAQDQVVSLDLKNVHYYELFNEIHKQTGVRFIYNTNQLEKMSLINVHAKKKKVSDLLTEVLASTPFTFLYDQNVVMLVQREEEKKGIRITGIVTDTKKEPLPGVTVIIKGTQLGAATDMEGRYSLTFLEGKENPVLVFTMVGMETVEVKYQGKDTINVVMQEDSEKLEDVIVTGYATIDRGSYVGAVTQIRAEDIQVAGEATIDQMLQGWVPGMSVINKTGKVGGSPKIRIRGTSTLLGNQEPLWVVDGVIQSDPLPIPDDANPLSSEMDGLRETASNAISWLNPADIETITVLKDASATAIYGTKATNGVIVITTKKAKGDGLNISYSGNIKCLTKIIALR